MIPRFGLRRRARRLLGSLGARRLRLPVGGASSTGLPFAERDLESRLVWILGAPRTGSTWLLNLLCDPLRTTTSAPAGFRPPPGWRGELDALPVDELLLANHIAPAFGEPDERDGRLVPRTLYREGRTRASYLLATEYEDVWRPALRRLALLRLAAVLERCRREGMSLAPAPLLVVKEVNGSHAAELLMSLFPRSRMIFLVRDWRDCVDSALDAWAEGGWAAALAGTEGTSEGERREQVRGLARLIAADVDSTAAAFAAHPPERRLLLRYEDLLAETPAVLGSLFGWLGLKRTGSRIERAVGRHSFSAVPVERRGSGRRHRAAAPGLWRENLSAEEQRVVGETLGPRLSRYGYED